MSLNTVNAGEVLSKITAPAASIPSARPGTAGKKSFQAVITGAGASGSTNIEVSNNNVNWSVLATLDVSSASPTAVYVYDASFAFVRANCTALTVTTGNLTVTCGEVI